MPPMEGREAPSTHVSQHWIRLDPPAHAWRSDCGDHDVLDERGHLHTADTWPDCHLKPHDEPWSAESLVGNILPWGAFSSFDCELKQGANGAPVCERTWVSLDGREVARYDAEYPSGDFRIEHTTWFEPKTGLLLRQEWIERDPRTGDLAQRFVLRDYEYDVELPEGVFDLPAGKPLVEEDRQAHRVDVKHTLPAAEREAIERLIARSNAAWSAGDFKRFSHAWHFLELPGTPILPGRAEWEEALRARPEGTTWVSAVSSINRSDLLRVWTGNYSFRPLPVAGVLWVNSRLQVESADGILWLGDVEYSVQKREEGFRLVHWNYPSEEIRAAWAEKALK
jgi:hypothetical protein